MHIIGGEHGLECSKRGDEYTVLKITNLKMFAFQNWSFINSLSIVEFNTIYAIGMIVLYTLILINKMNVI